jgi:hypothetical protein
METIYANHISDKGLDFQNIQKTPKTQQPYNNPPARHQWLTLVILATWEAEVRRIGVWGQPGQTGREIPSPK